MESSLYLAFVVTLVCAAITIVDGEFDKKMLIEHARTCMKEGNLSKEDMEAVKKHEYSEEKYKCFIMCIGEKLGYIKNFKFDEAGALNATEAIFGDDVDKKQKAGQIVKDCAQKLQENPGKGCDIGPSAAECLENGILEKGVMEQSEYTP
ncbi:uncharacterized protein LOC124358625 [Homalodisca vitripennis]|uniref:uncharacterized protein LOC124358625 n=1 Tax=Homalodisca vitripennis TaxID=197043 RepID=UPI001EEA4D2C|nr:uncharacterized protein LOC124358625 [Homalodisca vitripennis]